MEVIFSLVVMMMMIGGEVGRKSNGGKWKLMILSELMGKKR